MSTEHLGRADLFVAGAVGRPGRRSFYMEVQSGTRTVVMACEKEHVAALCSQGLRLLSLTEVEIDEAATELLVAAMLDRRPSAEPDFRIGAIGIGVDQDGDVALSLQQAQSEEEEQAQEEAGGIDFVVGPTMFRAMALVGLRVVAAGRSICPHCGLPMDPDGHDCPAGNGHFPK
jgi:uncharacterized repeat protein (TIGR03847 family)